MKRLGLLLVGFLATWFVLPLFQPGYIPTHDGEFSIIRIWQYSKMMSEGFVFPRWAPDLNSGYGVPLFTFYYPLPYFIASIIHFLGVSLVDAFKLTIGFSYVSAVILCFMWLRKLFYSRGAIVGTLFFLSVPYWFVDIYIRGSIGEVMAVTAIVAAFAAVEYEKPKLQAFSIAALILSHNIAAVLFLPLIAGYIMLRQKGSLYPLVWGLALSAFFWVPAVVEQRFVLGLSNFDFRDHFPVLAQLIIPSWGSGFSGPGWPSNEMSQQLGIGVLGLLVLGIIFVLREKSKEWRTLLTASLLAGFVAIFLMLENSLALWQLLTPLRFVQYPWRLLSVFILLAAVLGGYLAERTRWIAVSLVCIAIVVSLPYTRPVRYESRQDEYYLTRAEFTGGTTTIGNSFSTAWLPWQKEKVTQRFELIDGQAAFRLKESNPVSYRLQVEGKTNSIIQANISYYPGWRIFVDGKVAEVKEVNGRIAFLVPVGIHDIMLRFTETLMRKISDTISVASLFWLIGSTIL